MSYWPMLTDAQKLTVDNVYARVSDAFDSTSGGPYLWETLTGTFNPWEVISRMMMTEAISYINLYMPPALELDPTKVPQKWQPLHEKCTYFHFLKHLSRSYIEQPDTPGVNVPRLDRRRYRDEWKREAQDEQRELDNMLRQLKRDYLTKSRKLLVSGGVLPSKFITATRPSWTYLPVRY